MRSTHRAMRTLLLLLIVVAAVLVSPVAWAREAPSTQPASLEAKLAEISEKFDAPAVGLFVSTPSGIASAVHGTLDADSDEAVQMDDAWHIGSCTKAVVALLAARLVDQGVIEWNTTPAEGIDELPKSAEAMATSITLRQLLSHTSGLPGRELDMLVLPLSRYQMSIGAEGQALRKNVAAGVLSAKKAAEPGERWAYCNGGYIVVSSMLESAAGKPFEELMQDEVFKPLGITTAGWGPPDRIRGHQRRDEQWAATDIDNPKPYDAAGRLHLNLADWNTLCRAMLDNPDGFLSEASHEALFEPMSDEHSYALGWGIGEDADGAPLYVHAGSNTVWMAQAVLLAESGVVVLAVTNVSNGEVTGELVRLGAEVGRRSTINEHESVATSQRDVGRCSYGDPNCLRRVATWLSERDDLRCRMRIALGQTNPTVGAISANADKIVTMAKEAKDQGCSAIAFPELALIGYPPKDLLLRTDFIDAQLEALSCLAEKTAGIDVLVGYAERNEAPVGRPLHNAAALLRDGEVVSRHFKTLLPTYDVFDESRYFEPGPNDRTNNVINVCSEAGTDRCIATGVSICEDLWNDERLIARRLYHENPIHDLHAAGAKLMLNLSGSPFVVDKHTFRRELFAEQARSHGVPLLYVNQVGGNDELIFDGNSCAFDAEGNVIAQAKGFEEDLLIVDLDGVNRIESYATGIASLHEALVLGLRDYLRKCGFRKAVVGLSGGIDSAVTAAIAVEAIGAENVTGITMPSRYSSGHSVTDAKALADNLGIEFHNVPIKPMHDAFATGIDSVVEVAGLTEENLQARIRGATLMAYSNKSGAIVLTTGNKSELAVGYCTLYGDMCGGIAVLSDVPKTDVYKLARHCNERSHTGERIPENTITKPPSAELAPDQKDSDSLPEYEVLDGILYHYIELEEGPEQIVEAGFDRETVAKVIKLTDRSEFKRRQAAPGLKVTSRAFGVGRRMPIAQGYDPMTTKTNPIRNKPAHSSHSSEG